MSELPKPIIVEQNFNRTVREVWNAITRVEEMREWYFPQLEDFQAEVGFQTRFTVQVEDRVYPHVWTVTEVEEPRMIIYEWVFEGYPGKGTSTFELSKVDGSTKLTLTDITLEPFPQDIPEFKRESAVEGWNYLIRECLVEYLS